MTKASTFRATCKKEGCDFETTIGSELATHMKGHGRRPIVVPKLPKLKKPGYVPAQTKPIEFDVPGKIITGSRVVWSELVDTGETYTDDETGRTRPVLERVTRSGQVWSLGGPSKSAWVVPYEPREGEIAVLVRQRSYVLPGEPHFTHEMTWAPAHERKAA